MLDWKLYKLSEIAEVKYGKAHQSLDDGNIPAYGSGGLMRYVNRAIYEEESILIPRKGSLNNILFKKEPFWTVDTMFWTILNKRIVYPKFLYYLLTTFDFANMNVGSAVPSMTIDVLNNLNLFVPSLPEQIEIAEILSSLDDKIDILHRQNKTLEQIAETLFRQWFVEEAEEGWEVEKLGEVAVVQNGYAFRSKDYVTYQEGHLEVLKMGHIAVGGGLRTNPKKDFVPREEKLKKWTLNKNDIIRGMTDMKDNVVILGVPAIIDKSEKYVLNQRVARIYLKTNEKLLNCYLLYIQLNNKDFISTLQSKANSGVQVNLSTEEIRNCEILIPPMELQKDMGNTIADLFMKKDNNLMQIRTLTKLRDSLLPKLMSGEVRVFKK